MDYMKRIEAGEREMLDALAGLISYGSVETAPVKAENGEIMPFGRNIHECFIHTLKLAEELGFDTYNADNYGGHIEWKSKDSQGTFAITAHLDVVPEGTDWDSEPYVMTEKDGYVFGRGTADDKGPLIASLYAMKALRDSGYEPKMNIRLILGLDEETNKNGIIYYLDKAGQPDMGFTPDGGFPLINGEMGILFFDLARKLTKSVSKDGIRLTKLQAGTAANAVPGKAKAVIAAADASCYDLIKDRLAHYVLEKGYDIKAKKQGSSLVLEATGAQAHGAQPWLGLNAISIMMDFLGNISFNNEEINDYIDFYNRYIGFDLHGERIGCALADEPSGKLIFNAGLADITEEYAAVTINIRYPVTLTSDDVYGGIEKVIDDAPVGIVKKMEEAPIYLPLDDPMVEKLMTAYREQTGDDEAQPEVIGGGTYAKIVHNTLAYGGLFPGESDTMHQSNERMSIESFMKMTKIYARAVELICC